MAGVIVGAVIAIAPASASAATFYVDDSAMSPDNPCTNPAPNDACDTITDAITQARGTMFGGPDTILVAAGTYAEGVGFNDPADVGNTLDGAGSGTGVTSTVIVNPATTGSFSVVQDDISIRDVAVLGSNTQTFRVGWIGSSVNAADGVVLDNVRVSNDNMNDLPAIHVDSATNTTLNDVRVDGDADWDRSGAFNVPALKISAADNTVVNDSEFFSNDVGVESRISDNVTINRSTIAANTSGTNDQPALLAYSEFAASTSSLTLDSSLVIRGDRGVAVQTTGGAGPAATSFATIRNSTIDPGNPKGSTENGVGLSTTNGTTGVTIDSSIVMGTLTSTGPGGPMTCTFSDVPDTVQMSPPISCGSSGDPGNNSTSTPTQLFDPNILGIPNYSLLAGGPAIDTGNPAALMAGESTGDIINTPRVLDGNMDCVARRDKGAVEETGLSAPCPSGSSTSQTTVAENPECAVLRAKLKSLNRRIKEAVGDRKATLKKKRRKVRNRLRALGCTV